MTLEPKALRGVDVHGRAGIGNGRLATTAWWPRSAWKATPGVGLRGCR